MINITVYRDEKNFIYKMTIEGHADFAQRGQDIVCAGISSLSQSVLLALINHLKYDVDYKVDDGYLFFEMKSKTTEISEAVMAVPYYGFLEIAKKYPEYVNLSNIRR